MSKYVYHRRVDNYRVVARFGGMSGEFEQFEIGLISNGKWVAGLNFRHPDATPLNNRYDPPSPPELFAPPSQFYGVIDTLRNEEPVWFTLYEDPVTAFISTGAEPVGEAESKG